MASLEKELIIQFLADSIENVIQYLRFKLILPSLVKCKFCELEMEQVKASRIVDKYVCECMNNLCTKYKRQNHQNTALLCVNLE